LAKAAPNSRVGRIAAYRNAVLSGNLLEEDLAEALATLEGLEEPDRSVAEIDDAINTTTGNLANAESELEQLEADLEAAGGSDPDIEAAITEKTAEIEGLGAEIDALEEERAGAEAYEQAEDAVEVLDAQVADQHELELSLLDAAANKPVTEAVVTRVNALLGLE
jgi:chromosome segregation ATPase